MDDIIGKGFEWYTILELMFYASATNVSMALPLAILLSSIMTFGTLGENYELVAIKSAGISLQKAMMPLMILVFFISVGSFYFSDYILPKAYVKYGALLWDVRNKKLSFLIKEGVFTTSIPNYAIRVDHKNEDVDSLFGIMIYDNTGASGIPKITVAREGKLYKVNDGSYLVLKLKNGIRYEESNGPNNSSSRQVLSRMRFKETEAKLDFSSFQMKRTDEVGFSNVTEMLNLKGLKHKRDSLTKGLDSLNKYNSFSISSYYKMNNYVKGYSKRKEPPIKIASNILNSVPKYEREMSIQNGLSSAESIAQSVGNQVADHASRQREIIKTFVEYQRKFILAASCLLLFFIGAPLGAIIRKGGLGLPVVIAVVFFIFYHIINTVAEKSVKDGSLSIEYGMWMGIIILSPIGAFLTYKATVDSALFDVDYYKQIIVGWFKKKDRAIEPPNVT